VGIKNKGIVVMSNVSYFIISEMVSGIMRMKCCSSGINCVESYEDCLGCVFEEVIKRIEKDIRLSMEDDCMGCLDGECFECMIDRVCENIEIWLRVYRGGGYRDMVESL